ncbi:MAG TPA: YciI family protein [Ohtaekwangia sp.]|uniref:YciI family protein n=1 Tax=Ohtaekwangia sp. TaxID=2066019 RepID=UPI002F95ED01
MKNVLVSVLLLVCCSLYAQDKQYSFVFLHKKTNPEPMPKEQVDKLMEGHMANINRLAKEGKLLAAGPFEGGGGIFILNTKSTEEAKQWLSTDPGVQASRWDVEILPFTFRIASPCKAPEPYEMVTYEFIRFDAVVSKFTSATYPEIMRKHDAFLKQLSATGNVVMEGIFGQHDGGILLMRGDLQREVIEADPGLQEGLLEISYKKLWIAKGSFCEK